MLYCGFFLVCMNAIWVTFFALQSFSSAALDFHLIPVNDVGFSLISVNKS